MIAKINVTVAATLLSAAKRRAWFVLQNISDADIYVALDGSSDVTGAAGAKPGLLIRPGEFLADSSFRNAVGWTDANDRALYAIHEGVGNKVMTVQEA
jgi:hypothetical protein